MTFLLAKHDAPTPFQASAVSILPAVLHFRVNTRHCLVFRLVFVENALQEYISGLNSSDH